MPIAAPIPAIARPDSRLAATDLSGFGGILARRWRSILALTLMTLSISVAYLWMVPPTYTATTTLFIDPRPKKIVSEDPNLAGFTPDLALLDSQVAIIRSDTVLTRVVTAMKLATDPEFAPPPASGIKARIKALLGIVPTASDPNAVALANLAQHVVVKRASKTYVVDIETSSSSAVKAARLTQAIVDAYLADQSSVKSDDAKQAYAQIDSRLGELREQVRQAETKVDDFRKANHIVTSEGGTVGEQQLTRLNSELGIARGQLADAQARVNEVATAARTGQVEAITDPAKTVLVQRLREQLAQVSRREASLASQLLPRHPVLIDIHAQVSDLKAQIDAELKRVASTAKAEYAIAQSREREVSKALEAAKAEVGRTNTAQIKQRELEQEVAASRELLRIFLARAKETDEQRRITAPDARVISPASVPSRPSKPVPALILGLGLLGGLAAGIARALSLDHLDRSLRSPADMEARTRLRALALLPKIAAANPATSFPGRPANPIKSTPGVIATSTFGEQARALTSTKTREAALYRQAMAGLLASISPTAPRQTTADALPSPRVLLVAAPDVSATSAQTAFGVAYAAAIRGDRVLLVDAASSATTISNALAGEMPNRPVMLHDPADLATITTKDPDSGLTVLPIGLADLSLLKLDQRQRLVRGLTDLSRKFDLVVIDGGSTLEDPSAMIVQPVATQIVLVATVGRTLPDSLETAAQQLDPDHTRLVGVAMIDHAS